MKPVLTPKIDKNIAFQIETVTQNLRATSSKLYPTITISREFGCEGFPLANALVSRLNSGNNPWTIFSSDMLREISDKSEYNRELYEPLHETYRSQLQQDLDVLLTNKPSDYTRYKQIARNLKIIGKKGRTVIVGSGGAILAQNEKNFFHVRLTASLEYRINRISELLSVSAVEAAEIVHQRNVTRHDFINRFTNKDVSDPSFYHLIMRNDWFRADEMSELIIQALKFKKLI